MNKHPSMDQQLLERLFSVIENNLQNEQFGASELSKESGLSKSQLNRRLNSIIGKSTSQLIREYRLKKAMELLQNNVASVAEVSYMVGFGSPTYFNTCFHDYYGYPPGEVKIRKSIEEKRKPLISKKAVLIFVGALILMVLAYYSYRIITTASNTQENKSLIQDKSIAVLPVRNDSPDPENKHFCDGMMVEILDHLQRIEDLDVRSRTSVEKYRNTTKDIPTIGREINAAYVLESSGRKDGDRFRFAVRLIEARTDRQIWSETFEEKYSDLFVAQASIAGKIVETLGATLVPAGRASEVIKTNNMEAYDYVVQARYEYENYRNNEDREHLTTADDLVNKAIAIDPDYVDAYVEKTMIHRWLHDYDSILIDADKILEIDPHSPHGYVAKGRYYSLIGQTDLALEYLSKGLELSPNNDLTHSALAWTYLNQKNDPVKALQHFKKHLSLHGGNNPQAYRNLAFVYSRIGDYENAEKSFRKCIGSGSACVEFNFYSRFLYQQGALQEGIHFIDSMCNTQACENVCNRWRILWNVFDRNFEKARLYLDRWEPDQSWTIAQVRIGYVYLKSGNEDKAQKIFNEILNHEREYYQKAKVHAILGHMDEAFEFLRTWANEGNFTFEMKHDPMFDNIRDTQEFTDILNQVESKMAAIRAQIRQMEKRGELDI